jgi:hypothetical protein
MGGPGSGRRAEKCLTAAAYEELVDGLDLATADGLREYLKRLSRLNLTGKIPVHRYKPEVQAVTAQLRLLTEADTDRRIEEIRRIRDEIVNGRRGGRQLRDVGPPADDGRYASPKDDKPTSH